MGFPTWSHNYRLSYTFSLLYFSHLIKLLTILLFDFKLQVEGFDIPEDPQIHLTLRSCKFSTHHVPSRFLLDTLPLPPRISFWSQFHFSFFEYFCLLFILSFKTQDFDTFPLPQLVNIRLDELICWMVGSNSIIQVCSALVGWPGDVSSIEHLDDGPIPETSPAVDVLRWGLDDAGLTTTQEWCHRYFYFYFCFLICWCSFLF